MAQTKKQTFKQTWRNFKIRMSLLRIWAVKNLSLFLKIAVVLCIVFIFTGHIDSTTPILGDIFGELSEEIHVILTNNGSVGRKTVVNLLTTVGSLAITLFMFATKTKNIALTDIKSRKVKKALLDSGVYFNQNGEMVKRVEQATKMDINGDQKIGTSETSIDDIPNEGIFEGLKRCIRELHIIFTVKINDSSDINAMLKKAELDETRKAIEPVAIDLTNVADQVLTNEAESITSEKRTAQQKKGLFLGIKSMIHNTKDSLSLKGLEKELKKEEEQAAIKEKEDKLLTTTTEELPDVSVKEDEINVVNTTVTEEQPVTMDSEVIETPAEEKPSDTVQEAKPAPQQTRAPANKPAQPAKKVDPVEEIFRQARMKKRRN